MISILPYYYIGTMIAIILLVFIRHNNNFDYKINHDFIIGTWIVLALEAVDAIEAFLAMASKPSIWRVVVSSMGYVLRPLALYMILRIAVRTVPKKVKWIILLPLIIDAIISFSALFCDIAFSYDANNQFQRGPLGYTPFVVAAIYSCLLLILNYKLVKSSHREEGVFLFVMIVNSIISTGCELFWKTDAMIPTSLIVFIAFYYMFFHTYQNSRDMLTGALLRRRFYLDCEKWKQQLTGIISIDLNELKELNDRKGHVEGDKAIATLASIINKVLPRYACLYRIGGDEFSILCRKLSMDEIQKIVLKIQQEMSKTPYSCAVGIAEYDIEEGLDAACNKADAMMYEDKIRIKGEEYRIKYHASECM